MQLLDDHLFKLCGEEGLVEKNGDVLDARPNDCRDEHGATQTIAKAERSGGS